MRRPIALYLLILLAVILSLLAPQALGWMPPYALAGLFFGSLFIWREQSFPLRTLGFGHSPERGRQIVRGMAAGMISSVLVVGLLIASGSVNYEQLQWASVPLAAQLLSALARTGLVVLVEETVFRGFYLQLVAFRRGVPAAVLVSSALWAILYLPALILGGVAPAQIVMSVIFYLLLGTVLGLAFVANGRSLWLTMAIHFGYAYSLAAIGILTESTVASPDWLAGDGVVVQTSLAGLLLCLLLMLIVWLTASDRSAWRRPFPKPENSG